LIRGERVEIKLPTISTEIKHHFTFYKANRDACISNMLLDLKPKPELLAGTWVLLSIESHFITTALMLFFMLEPTL